MIKCLFRGIMSSIAARMLINYRHLSIQRLRIEAAKSYLHGVRMARLSAIGLIRAGLMIGLVGLGALLFHAGLFVLLPWSLQAKALLGAGLGLVYVICGCLMLRAATNEKMWMDKSGITRMLGELTGVKNERTAEGLKTK